MSFGSRKSSSSFIESLESRQLLSTTPLLSQLDAVTITTAPASGIMDVNPYGIAFAPNNFPTGGNVLPGDILVSNFNSATGGQGTGTTITRIKGNGTATTFFKGSAQGLDGGLAILSKGFVLVGSEPATAPGSGVPAATGSSILIINKDGKQVGSLTSSAFLDGPWDFQAIEQDGGSKVVLFVSNALSGTVSRLTLAVPSSGNNITITSEVQIASGYTHGPNTAAFILGPAGVAYDAANGDLYVNAEGNNAVYSIPNAMTATADHGKGTQIYFDNHNLHGPLGLILANNGNLILANADGVNADPAHPSELVEITTAGKLVATKFIDPADGGAFNIAESFTLNEHRFAYVDDNTNTITIYTLPTTNNQPLLPQLNAQVYSTVPAAGDVNPYGIAFVPNNFPTGGNLAPGDVLVANFNNNQNIQGTGTTLTRIKSNGTTTTFYKGSEPLGLDAGLAVLSRGFVLVGNLPGKGTPSTPASTGSSILIINKDGKLVGQLTSTAFLNGPWDFQAIEENSGATVVLFISNALSGTVTRMVLSVPSSGNNIQITSEAQIASGYTHGPNAAAFVLGPAGVAYDAANGDLYVAAEGNNAIFEIPDAMTTGDDGKGKEIFVDNHDLHGPLGMILASDGNLIIANADGVNPDPAHPSELVEISTAEALLATRFIDPNDGGAFNIAESFTLGEHRFAYVDDNTSTLTIFTLT